MKIEKTINVVLEPEDKETVKKFNLFISNICRNLRGECEFCPIKKQCTQLGQAISCLESL